MEYMGIMDFGWTFVMQVISVVVLFLILKKFFFEKVHNYVVARQDSIKDAIDSADALNRKADEKMDAYTRKIAGYEEEGREIIRVAKKNANEQAQQIVDDANKKAGEMIVAAEKEIERERVQAMHELRAQISDIAMQAAVKIVEADVELGDRQDAIIDQVIEEAGNKTWQN